MNQNKIIPNIWFSVENGKIETLIKYYQNIFDKSFEYGTIIPLGETPSGNTEICEVKIFGQIFLLMSTALQHHNLNDSISFVLNCEDQKEIDKFWDYFTKEGKESQCGWCIDKFGLRWQVLPKNLNELMSKPNSFEVMMRQKKIVIEEYLK